MTTLHRRKKALVAPQNGDGITQSLHVGYQRLAASDTEIPIWLPLLTLIGALGLLLVAFADTTARNGTAWAKLLFWAGILLVFVPIAARLISPCVSRRERIGLVAMLGLGLYLVKLLHSPLDFTFYDEFLHWRTFNDILQSGCLFKENPILPVSPRYPGLEIVTSALVSLSELSVFTAGIVVIGAARLVLVLALYLLYEEISCSPLVAGVSLLLYMTSPHFVFFDAQFSYESLALPFAVLILYAIARRARSDADNRIGLTLVILLGLGAVVITHHLTSYALVSSLAIWTAVSFFSRSRGKQDQQNPSSTAIMALVASLTWLVYVATIAAQYMSSVLSSPIMELIRWIAGEPIARQPFRSSGGQFSPLWEQCFGYASVILILLGLALGTPQVWRRYRTNAAALVLAVVALAFPASLALRLVPSGVDVAGRATAFLFVGIAFVLAVGFEGLSLSTWLSWRKNATVTVWIVVIFIGGVIFSSMPWTRLPGPYLVAAGTRSIEPQSVAAAEWTPIYLGPGNRIGADRTNGLLMGSYGQQYPVTLSYDWIDVPQLFFSPEVGVPEQTIIQEGLLRYLVVDKRLADALPMFGIYFEGGEPNAERHVTPIDPAALSKFDGLENVDRVFDSGDIVIYDIGALSYAP